MKKLLIVLGVIIVIIILIVVLKKNTVQEIENFAIGQANVSKVLLTLQESFPVNVSVQVMGELPDSCTELGDVVQTYDSENKQFSIDLQTKRPLDSNDCIDSVSSFDISFMLEKTDNLSKGDYTVVVNGVEDSFSFEIDNFISTQDSIK